MALRTKRRTGAQLTAAGLMGLLLLGCGDGSGVTDDSAALTDAKTVCDDVAGELRAVMDQLDGKPSTEQMQRIAGELAPIMRRTADVLASVEPPSGEEAQFAAFVAKYDEDTAALEEAAQDEERAAAMSHEPPFGELTVQARELGLAGCVPVTDGPTAEGAEIGEGLRQVEVGATEYEFLEIPPQAFPGNYEITLVNSGSESHELSIVRLKEGTTAASVIEAQEAGEDPATLVEDFLGTTGPVAPGGSGNVTVSLEDGATYGYACLIEAPDGMSHAAKGMVGDLEITTAAG